MYQPIADWFVAGRRLAGWLVYSVVWFAAGVPAAAQPIRLDIDPRYEYRLDGVHVVVNEVIEGGLADRLGIQPNERIELIDGQPILSVDGLLQRLSEGPPLTLYVRNPNSGKRRVVPIQAAGQNGPGLALGGGASSANAYRLTNVFLGPGRALHASPKGELSMAPAGEGPTEQWELRSVGGGRYRLTNRQLGPGWSLTAGDFATMERTDQNSPRQLWRIEKQGEGDIQILHLHQGNVLALDVDLGEDNAPILSLRDNNAGQLWKLNSYQPVDQPDVAAPLPIVDLRPRLISRKEIPNEPLPPANVELENSYDEQLLVVLRDLREKAAPREIMIPAGQSKIVRLHRDAGTTIVETWEIPLHSGELTIQERERRVPPRPLYTLSVYELFVQSLSIDATKRGKGRIDDISYSPKSVGLIPAPAGDELEVSTIIDVYREARRQRYPGAVDHLDPSEWNSGGHSEDPIKKILRQHRAAN